MASKIEACGTGTACPVKKRESVVRSAAGSRVGPANASRQALAGVAGTGLRVAPRRCRGSPTRIVLCLFRLLEVPCPAVTSKVQNNYSSPTTWQTLLATAASRAWRRQRPRLTGYGHLSVWSCRLPSGLRCSSGAARCSPTVRTSRETAPRPRARPPAGSRATSRTRAFSSWTPTPGPTCATRTSSAASLSSTPTTTYPSPRTPPCATRSWGTIPATSTTSSTARPTTRTTPGSTAISPAGSCRWCPRRTKTPIGQSSIPPKTGRWSSCGSATCTR